MATKVFLDLDKRINVLIDGASQKFELLIHDPVVFDFVSKHINVIFNKKEDIISVLISDQLILSLSFDGKITPFRLITSFEVKMIYAHQEKPILERKDYFNYSLTDLHTHFTAIPRGKTLINLGLKYDIDYPTNYLKEIGIKINSKERFIKLSSLSELQLEKLRFALSIKAYSITIFNLLEKIYKYREPFTKNILLFKDLLDSIAYDYSRAGVKYIEISQSLFYTDKNYLKIVHECLPEIEDKYDITIRFLCAIRRNDYIERSLDRIDIIRSLAKSKYIVGVDFLGHETNTTKEFRPILKECLLLSMNIGKYFVIRIHAGETRVHSNNINSALKYASSIYQKESKKHICKKPIIRIGHGLYGVNDKTTELAKATNAIIEFNITSNLSLNNIISLQEIPVKKFADNGVDFLIGTDGPGIYRTGPKEELFLAINSSLSYKNVRDMTKLEKQIINDALSYQKDYDTDKLYKDIKYQTIDGERRYHDTDSLKEKGRIIRHVKSVKSKLENSGVDDNLDSLQEKCPILITGSSKSNWPKLSKTAKDRIKRFASIFVANLNPDKYYLVTGGTNYGVEKIFHEAAYKSRQTGRNVEVLATLVGEAKVNEIRKNTINKYMFLSGEDGLETDWYGYPYDITSIIKEKEGIVIAFAGGIIVNDIIQASYNLDIPMFLMKDVGGASSKKSKFLHHSQKSFRNITDFQTLMKKDKIDLFSDDNYDLVDIQEYVKNTKIRPFYARKVGNIKVREALKGEEIKTYASGILETVYIAKKGEYVVTKLNKNNKVFVDKNGNINEWIISKERLANNYCLLKDDIYSPVFKKFKFIRVNKNISFMTPRGKMLLLRGGYLNISDFKNIYGIQKKDFESTYVIIK